MKQKTKKAAEKRFFVTGTGKVRRRKVNQAHFNARETGDEMRHKHGSAPVHETDMGRVQELLPYA